MKIRLCNPRLCDQLNSEGFEAFSLNNVGFKTENISTREWILNLCAYLFSIFTIMKSSQALTARHLSVIAGCEDARMRGWESGVLGAAVFTTLRSLGSGRVRLRWLRQSRSVTWTPDTGSELDTALRICMELCHPSPALAAADQPFQLQDQDLMRMRRMGHFGIELLYLQWLRWTKSTKKNIHLYRLHSLSAF